MESHKNQHIEIVHYKTKDNERDGIMWIKPQKGQMRTRKLMCSSILLIEEYSSILLPEEEFWALKSRINVAAFGG